MGKSVSETKVNKEAQGAVDQAESKINKAKNFFGSIKSKLEKERTPDDGKIAKAEKFVGEMEQGNDTGSGGGGLLKKIGDGALGLVLGKTDAISKFIQKGKLPVQSPRRLHHQRYDTPMGIA